MTTGMRFHQLSMPVRCHLMFHAFLYLAAISLSFVSAAIRKAWKRIWNLYSRAKVGFLFFLMRPAITIKIPNTPDGSISLACPGHACNTKVKKPKERKDTQEMNGPFPVGSIFFPFFLVLFDFMVWSWWNRIKERKTPVGSINPAAHRPC